MKKEQSHTSDNIERPDLMDEVQHFLDQLPLINENLHPMLMQWA